MVHVRDDLTGPMSSFVRLLLRMHGSRRWWRGGGRGGGRVSGRLDTLRHTGVGIRLFLQLTDRLHPRVRTLL